jgi:L-malate glycosyltransferase
VLTHAPLDVAWGHPPRTERVRLLKFLTIFAIGGTERQVAALAEGLDRSTFELRLACLRRAGLLLERVEQLEHKVVDYRISNLYGHRALAERLRFARYLRQHEIEIVHTYNFYPNVFAIPAARLAGTPVVIASIRDTGAYLTPMKQRVQKLACRFADCVVANAEAVRQWLIDQGYDESRITVIRNGVDMKRFAVPADGPRIRAELGVAPRAPLVAVVSRLSRTKGLEDFLEASADVARTIPEARFLIVGEGTFKDSEYQRDLAARANRLGVGDRVVFTGLRLDVPELLSEVAVSVLPSLSEGLSNTLLESLAAGVPTVATRVGGNSEAVEDGVTGLLVPPRDPGALARAVRRLLQDPELAGRFGVAARQRAVKHFSFERMIRETEDLYVRLLEAKQHAVAR